MAEPDTSDIPEVGEDWFEKAKLVLPKPEPFCIKPEDIFAIQVINYWIGLARLPSNVASLYGNVSHEKLAKARLHRDAMIAWRGANPDKVKVPD